VAVLRFRFGSFEIDGSARELRRNGLRIRIEEQPFRVLWMLVSRPSDVVTREELKHFLWSDDTHVDFDRSLTRAVNKVRLALGDSASNPRFVETLTRRGYRFIAPVTAIEAAGAGLPRAGGDGREARHAEGPFAPADTDRRPEFFRWQRFRDWAFPGRPPEEASRLLRRLAAGVLLAAAATIAALTFDRL
jgi:DNA-binding winged helix-turn-helix (wHTH) protein